MALIPKIEGKHLLAAAASLVMSFLLLFLLNMINHSLFLDLKYPLVVPQLILALATLVISAKYNFSREDVPALGICMFLALLVGYFASDFISAALENYSFSYYVIFEEVYSPFFFVNTFSFWTSLTDILSGLLRILLTFAQSAMVYSVLVFLLLHFMQKK